MPERNLSSNANIIHISVTPDQPVIFEFAASEAFFGRSGNDLNITLESGEQILTEDYFIADAAGHLPPLQFADIPAVAGELFLTEASPQLDISPAAGQVRSGGLSSYSDASGDLISGLEGSDSLGSVSWSAEAGKAEPAQSTAALPDNTQAVQPPVVPPQPPQPPQPPVQPPVNPAPATSQDYDARAVLYSLTRDGDPMQQEGTIIRFASPDGAKALYGSSSEGLIGSFNEVPIDGVTYYEMKVSAAGKSAMADALQYSKDNGVPIPNVYDYITLDLGNGVTKVIQVILNQTGVYDSAAEDTANPHGQAQDVPEWHMQPNQAFTANRILGDANDEMWFDNHISSYKNPGGMLLNLGEGDNTLNVDGSIFAAKGSEPGVYDVTVKSGDGDDNINIRFVVQGSGAKNTIDTGLGNDVVKVGGTVLAQTGGNTLIIAEEGKVILGANVVATNQTDDDTAQSNTIIAKNISLNNDAGEGVMAEGANSENILKATEDINIEATSTKLNNEQDSTGIFARGSSDGKLATSASNTLEAGGDINISSTGISDNKNLDATGILSDKPNAVIDLKAGGDISVDVSGGERFTATGISSAGATKLKAEDSVNITADGQRSGVGVKVGGVGQVNINADTINIEAGSADGNAIGLYAYGANSQQTSGTILEGENISISADSTVTDYAMYAFKGTGNDNNGDVYNKILAKGSSYDKATGAQFGDTGLNVELEADQTMYAVWDGASNTIIGSDAKDVITASGQMQAWYGGENRIMTGDGDDEINVSHMIYSEAGGKNIIDAGEGDNAVNFGGYVTAQGSGAVEVSSGSGDDKITFNGQTNAAQNGNLVVNAGDGDNTLDFNGGIFSYTEGNAKVLTGDGNDTVNIQSLTSWTDGETIINTGSGADTVNIGANAANAMLADTGGTNKVTSNTVNVHGNLAGMNAESGVDKYDYYQGAGGATNIITGNEVNVSAGDANLPMDSFAMNAAGDNIASVNNVIQAHGSQVDLANGTLSFGDTHGINVELSAASRSADRAMAMQAGGGGANYIVGSDLDDAVSIQGNILSERNGQNAIHTGDGADNIAVKGTMTARDGGQNIIDAGDGNNTLSFDKRLLAENGGSNIIKAGSDDDNITFKSPVSTQSTVAGAPGSSTIIDAGDGDNTLNFLENVSATISTSVLNGAHVDAGMGNKLSVLGGIGQDTIKFSKDLSVNEGGSININAGDGDNTITVDGMLKTHINSSTSIITGSGDDLINIKQMQSGANAHTLINTGKGNDTVSIDSTGSGATTTGLTAYAGGSNTIISENVKIYGVSRGVEADLMNRPYGGFTSDESALNVISGGNVEISADNSGEKTSNIAYGLYAAGKAGSSVHNVIQAQGSEVDLATGTVTFGEPHAISVVISAASGSAERAVAMLAKGTAVNYIVGSDAGDTITIQGNILSEDGGRNIINTGGEDDVITIQGHVQVGALNIYAGEGSDTLVLVADSLEQFNQYYRDWLNDMDADEWNGMGIESVHVQVSDPSISLADIAWLTNPGGVFASSGTEVVFDMNDAFTLNVDAFGENGSSSLGELVGIVDSFDSIDMSGNRADTLNIDGLLNGLSNLDPLDEDDVLIVGESSVSAGDLVDGLVLRITGDEGEDKVTLGGNWNQTAAGSVQYGETTYNIYTNSDADNQYVLVQQNLML